MSKFKYEVELDRVSDWMEFESDKELSEWEILERAIEEISYQAKLYKYEVTEIER